MKLLFTTLMLLFSIHSYANEYDKHYEDGSAGISPYRYYDDGSHLKPDTNVLDKFYSDNDSTEAPTDVVDSDEGQQQAGYNYSSEATERISNENFLLNILKNMVAGDEIEPMSETYICNADNVTYGNRDECNSKCTTLCGIFKFGVELSCQTSERVLTVSVADSQKMSKTPQFTMQYKKDVATTPPVTAVCVNGFKSGNNFYTYDIQEQTIDFIIPFNSADVGECYDIKDVFFVSYNEYYKYLSFALEAHLSRLGFMLSHNTTGNLELVFDAIVAGICEGGVLNSDMPNEEEIEVIRQTGGVPSNVYSLAADNDMYNLVTADTGYSGYSCSIQNNVQLFSDVKVIQETVSFEDSFDNRYIRSGNHDDECRDNGHNTFAYVSNSSQSVKLEHERGKHVGNIFDKRCEYPRQSISVDYKDDIDALYKGRDFRVINSTLYIHSKEETSTTSDVRLHLVGGNRIQSDYVPYIYNVKVEYYTKEEHFDVIHNNSCSPADDCILQNEYICDMHDSNCVQTIINTEKTNIEIPNLCNEISTSSDNYLVCSDGATIRAIGQENSFSASASYFTIKRDYICGSGKEAEYDYSKIIAQNELINSTAKLDEDGNYSFVAIDFDGNGVKYDMILDPPKTNDCIQTCKVKLEEIPDNISTPQLPDGTSSDNVSLSFASSYYKECTQKKQDEWTCELDEKEIMVTGGECSCPDDFVDTIINLKLVQSASDSMVCSDK